jgi:putative flippase GtrA
MSGAFACDQHWWVSQDRSERTILAPASVHNIAMQRLRAVVTHPATRPMLRYGVAGATVAAVYLGIPVILNGGLGLEIQIAIPIAYVLAVSLHFLLQRHFVFRHVPKFALSGREQATRYVAVGAVQYPTTALSTALLPGVLGLSQRATFVCTTLAISFTFFLVLRAHVFHPTDESEPPAQ